MPGARLLAMRGVASDPSVWTLSSDRLRLAEVQKYGNPEILDLRVAEEAANGAAVPAAALE